MNKKAFTLGVELKSKEFTYNLVPRLWGKRTLLPELLNLENWHIIKYLNDKATGFSPEVNNIPSDTGGLYIFIVKSPVVVGLTEFPCYIGRAKTTDHQNLNKRVKEYFSKYRRSTERPRITVLFEFWKKYLYVAYCAIEENEDIVTIEAELINSLMFPLNEEIPNQIIKEAKKAFR